MFQELLNMLTDGKGTQVPGSLWVSTSHRLCSLSSGSGFFGLSSLSNRPNYKVSVSPLILIFFSNSAELTLDHGTGCPDGCFYSEETVKK